MLMRIHASVLVAAALVAAAPRLSAQMSAPPRTQAQLQASLDAHRHDFDYLLGDWRFDAKRKDRGTFHGLWTAVRLAGDAQVLDEYRVVGDSGQTFYVSSTLRSYNVVDDRWDLVSSEGGMGLRNLGTGKREGDEMHIEQKFFGAGPQPAIWRIRYYDIAPDHFSWNADVSRDGGKTWTTGFMTIEARRVGPPHDVAPLTPLKAAAPTGS